MNRWKPKIYNIAKECYSCNVDMTIDDNGHYIRYDDYIKEKDSNVVNPLLCAGWRDCSEELPDKAGLYLCIDHIGKYHVAEWYENGWWNRGSFKLTHWTLLPDPPTGI